MRWDDAGRHFVETTFIYFTEIYVVKDRSRVWPWRWKGYLIFIFFVNLFLASGDFSILIIVERDGRGPGARIKNGGTCTASIDCPMSR